VAAAGVASATLASAQVRGLPLYNSGVPSGIGLAADVGFPNEDAGSGRAFGVTGSAGMGLFGATATIATYNPGGPGDSEMAFGATASYRVFGGPLIPLAVSMQAGVGYMQQENMPSVVKELHVPVGVGFALTIPNPALAIKPWLAPRIDIVRQTVETAEGITPKVSDSDTETSFGLSGGIDFNFINGLGVRAAYDMVTAGSGSPGVFGFGVNYALRVPGQ
jgi:opacity protein-like surface antigen